MVFHNLNPEAMKQPQRPEPGARLTHDGSNIASVVKHLAATDPDRLMRVLEYVRGIGVPISSIDHKQAGSLETLEVMQDRGEANRPTAFDAISLSDGTIRALGILISLASVNAKGALGPSLIGIEEPETALHPAAAGALMDAMLEGSERTQLIITCHSPDLLEHSAITPEMIRPVVIEEGSTRVGSLAPRKAELLRQHLATAGELMRLDQLEPDPEDLARQKAAKGTLFEHNP
jgi:predicted ATPase